MTWLCVFLSAASSLRTAVQLFLLSFSSSWRSNLISHRQHYHVRTPAWDRAYHLLDLRMAQRVITRDATRVDLRSQSSAFNRNPKTDTRCVTIIIGSYLSPDELGGWANDDRDFARLETHEGCVLARTDHLTNLSGISHVQRRNIGIGIKCPSRNLSKFERSLTSVIY